MMMLLLLLLMLVLSLRSSLSLCGVLMIIERHCWGLQHRSGCSYWSSGNLMMTRSHLSLLLLMMLRSRNGCHRSSLLCRSDCSGDSAHQLLEHLLEDLLLEQPGDLTVIVSINQLHMSILQLTVQLLRLLGESHAAEEHVEVGNARAVGERFEHLDVPVLRSGCVVLSIREHNDLQLSIANIVHASSALGVSFLQVLLPVLDGRCDGIVECCAATIGPQLSCNRGFKYIFVEILLFRGLNDDVNSCGKSNEHERIVGIHLCVDFLECRQHLLHTAVHAARVVHHEDEIELFGFFFGFLNETMIMMLHVGRRRGESGRGACGDDLLLVLQMTLWL